MGAKGMSTSSGADKVSTVMRPSAKSRGQAAFADDVAEAIADEAVKGEAIKGGEAIARTPPDGDFQALLAGFRLDHGAIPPLVVGAAPLLALAHSLFRGKTEPDVTALRETAIAAVRDYERDLAGARIAPERARAAHYVVCALIDDVVLSKPWGVRGGWARSGLVSTFHMDVTGGERVFDLLDHFHRNPGANKDLLLLIYLSLSLGFEGRTRVSPRGTMELMQIRDGLYRTLRSEFGSFERELSPHWRGENARHKQLRNLTLLWTLLGVLLLALAVGYLLFTLLLNRNSDTALDSYAVIALGPSSYRPALRPIPPTPIPTPTPTPTPVPRDDPYTVLSRFLETEVKEKLVTLTRKDRAVLVRIYNSGLFDSGSAEIKPAFNNVLMRIGAAVAEERFKALVIGHTDNVRIGTLQYPSNWHLSEARAKVVATMLSDLTGPGVITFEGRADTEPIGDNATPEGREANRRTEILVFEAAERAYLKPPEESSTTP